MQLGVVFPQTEIGPDPGAVRDFAQAVEGLGYDHVEAYDHVLGAGVANRPDWQGFYTQADLFHEVFVLFGYLAAVTRRIGLVTGVLVLPQRETALVAKQAAEVDVLSGGRLRLGIGVGWNAVEYEALGQGFLDRGGRIEEQVEVLRALWCQDVVTYEGRWHHIVEAGLNPLPVQRPIPIWMGGGAGPVLRRVARLADGWFPPTRPAQLGRVQPLAGWKPLDRLRAYAQEAGRDPGAIGIEGRIRIAGTDPAQWVAEAAGWQALGATHLAVNTMKAGLSTPDQHIDAIRRFKDAVEAS